MVREETRIELVQPPLRVTTVFQSETLRNGALVEKLWLQSSLRQWWRTDDLVPEMTSHEKVMAIWSKIMELLESRYGDEVICVEVSCRFGDTVISYGV